VGIADAFEREEVPHMKETATFVGWGGRVPGRELSALETFKEWTAILDDLKKTGEVEDYLPVLLGPHGGELEGFVLVFADPEKIAKIEKREDVHKLQLRATFEHTKFSVIPAIVGKGVEAEYEKLAEDILPALV
jgi:hypothetical protein